VTLSRAEFKGRRILILAAVALVVPALASCTDSHPSSPPSLRRVAQCLHQRGAWDVSVDESPERFVRATFTPRGLLQARVTYGFAVAEGEGPSDERRLLRALEQVTKGTYSAHPLRLDAPGFVGASVGPATSPSAAAPGTSRKTQALVRRANLAGEHCVSGVSP
jgi:hypothetical protein